MLKISPHLLSRTAMSKSGIKIALFTQSGGLSTLGAYFPVGGQHGKVSGETFVTLHSKVLDAIGSPENAFQHAISPYIDVREDSSFLSLQFPPESSQTANRMFNRFFQPIIPSPASVSWARRFLNLQMTGGHIAIPRIMQDLANSAAFTDLHSVIETHTADVGNIKFNSNIIAALSDSCALIGSSDQSSELARLTDPFKPISQKPQAIVPEFRPATITHKFDVSFKGVELIHHPEYPHVAITFPAPSFIDDDFIVFNVIRKLFGGSSSFSSEGFGSGSSSLFVKDVLYRVPNCEEIQCEFSSYSDHGLMAMRFNAASDSLENVTERIRDSINKALQISDAALISARELAVVQYLKAVEGGSSMFSKAAKELSILGEPKSHAGVVKALRSVSKGQICEAVRKYLIRKPCVVVLGNANPQKIQSMFE
jgi:hypothetical protein